MKQTSVTVMFFIAYVIEWRKTRGKSKMIYAKDLFAHDTKFILFMRACFARTDYTDNSSKFWLDTPRPEPLTEAEEIEFIKPLAALKESELNDLCRFAGVEVQEAANFIGRLNIEKGE